MDITKLVDAEQGLVSRQTYVDPEIYSMELKKIFGRCWLYIGHESQIKKPHDFIMSSMGEDPIIVNRDGDGKVHAFHNSCRHRGMKVVRVERGSAKTFQCPWHSWTYNAAGKLVGLSHRSDYEEVLDPNEWGLIEVPRVETLGGLIFANWDAGAMTLREYLGDAAFYLELAVDRDPTGSRVATRPFKTTWPFNWKILAAEVGDFMHADSLHQPSIKTGFMKPMGEEGYSLLFDNGHGMGGPKSGFLASAKLGTYAEKLEQMKRRLVEKHGEAILNVYPVGSMQFFPNFDIFDSHIYRIIRVYQPRGLSQCEMWTFPLADNSMPDDVVSEMMRALSMTASPGSGIVSGDDNAVREYVAETHAAGRMAWDYPLNFQLGLGDPRTPASEVFGGDFPGTVAKRFPADESNARNWYAAYRSWLSGPDAAGEDRGVRRAAAAV